ncbi:hypothetical protein F5J12DRAFT_802348 [Pisolithus orientalis]|uniref:uncharacterized protein n=1 Tax=Pisolithus orientalis TaxID=936130 RepID=UPI0022244806|nr:uncharacterized protein F5J12DRAFT_802348 [Pisolithus orientalis]KAI6030709.1 hypothetical protein F5J12DRAFT_802348 [Pisolithus orientalis]
MFTTLALSLFSLVSCVLTVPLPARDVVDPPITSPTASTVWNVGETQTVTWSTANLPANITNPDGMLVLGYVANNSENLMLQSPLATNLSYSVGQAQITVPNVPTGTNYIVVLFGDSGNASPQFAIMNGASSGTSATATSPPVMTSTTPSSPSPTTTPSNGLPNQASSTGQSSAPVVTVTSTSAITISPSGTSSSSASASATSQAAVSSQTNAAGSKFVPSSHYSLFICLVLASLFVL